MRKYIAGYKGKTVEIASDSLYGAKLKAIAYFNPSKKDYGALWVELADVPLSTANL